MYTSFHVYRIPQAGKITRDALVQKLSPYGYHPSKNTPGLWTHNSRPIIFTFVVDGFGGKYSEK